MCLSEVTNRAVVLKEDMKCYGVLEETDKGWIAQYYDEPMSIGLNQAKTNLDPKKYGMIGIGSKYPVGFHRYTDKDNVIHYTGIWSIYCRVFEFTIPKGTKVTIGRYCGCEVVVTPVIHWAGESARIA